MGRGSQTWGRCLLEGRGFAVPTLSPGPGAWGRPHSEDRRPGTALKRPSLDFQGQEQPLPPGTGGSPRRVSDTAQEAVPDLGRPCAETQPRSSRERPGWGKTKAEGPLLLRVTS